MKGLVKVDGAPPWSSVRCMKTDGKEGLGEEDVCSRRAERLSHRPHIRDLEPFTRES